METLRYPYKPKAYVMALSGLLFAGLGAFFVKLARENDEGLLIDRVIRLNPQSATAFYWLLAAFCIGFVLISILGLFRSFGPPREIVLDRAGISAPKNPLRPEPVTLPYASITDLRMTQVRSQHFLTIHHAGGKLSISRSMLPSTADFDQLAAELDRRWRGIGRG